MKSFEFSQDAVGREEREREEGVVMTPRARALGWGGALASACMVSTQQERFVSFAKSSDWRRHGDDDSNSVASIKQVRNLRHRAAVCSFSSSGRNERICV